MSARFRIRTSSGQEISFASLDVFSEFVRSGDVAPDDVVYDAETKEWSSALTHPVVLQIQLDAEEASKPSGPAASDSDGVPGAPATLQMQDIGLDLAPAPSQLTPEQEAAAFVAKMEAERAAEIEVGDEAPMQGFTMESGGMGSQVLQPAAPPRRVEPRPAPVERQEPPEYVPEPRYEPPRREEEPVRSAPPKQRKVGSGAARRYAPFVIIVLVLGGAGVYFGPDLLTSSTGSSDQPTQDDVATEPAPPPCTGTSSRGSSSVSDCATPASSRSRRSGSGRVSARRSWQRPWSPCCRSWVLRPPS
ncbi:MAG: hypothetical protein FJ207_11040 [Gemmatimonadetes bacterium]|nr:hypothetical protein [Gemmatimonadota bacterium]